MQRALIDRRYKKLKMLGSGATGTVYKVKDIKNNKVIALKILSKKKTSSETIQRFKREFRLLTVLCHPNLCLVHDFGTLKDGRSYFTMEYIEGKNIFQASESLPYEKIYSWIVQLCRVLEYIHSKGLIHYDIKPGNVLVYRAADNGDEACVKLMDFGLVGEKRIRGGALIRGTFPYIAPEVIEGLAVDQRADLYALGVLLYEIFTRRSFQKKGKTSFATLFEQSKDRIIERPSKVVADIPKDLERLIVRLLAFEPAVRYSRANEVIKEINKLTGSKFAFETEKTLEGYLLSSRFVGRDKEMNTLKSFYERACQDEGKVVLVTGDAGIGKSRLLKEFKVFAQLKRSHCFTGYAYKNKTKTLEPFYDIFKELINYIDDGTKIKTSLAVLSKMFPDLMDGHLKRKLPKLVSLEPKQEKLRNFEALSELLGHCATNLGELIILLDDLHWADDLSLQFLEYLGHNLTGRDIFICGTCRREELRENTLLKRIISNLSNDGCLNQIELRPLTFKNLYSFLDSTITPGSNSAELVRYLMKKTGGNPFFVEEIMRILLQKRGVSIGERIGIKDFKHIAIPETIEDVVLKRIEDLDSTSQQVVKFGAVLLKGFKYDLMRRLTRLEDTGLSEALWTLKKRKILVEQGNTYRFYHATLREAINKHMAYREKRKLYYQTGRTLELIYKRNIEGEGVVEDLAYYFINARDHKKGIAYGLRAAKKSSEQYANEQAIKFYKSVLGFLPNKNLTLRFDILHELAQIEVLTDYYDDAIKHYNKALSLKTGTTGKRIKVYLGNANVYVKRGEHKKALYIYKRVARLLREMKPGRLKALLETSINVRICKAYLVMGNYRSANKFNFDILQFPMVDLQKKETIGLLTDIYNNLGAIEIHKGIHAEIDYDKAIGYYKKVYKYSKKINAEDKVAAALNNLGICYQYKYDFQKASDCYQKAIQISERVGDHYGVLSKLLNLATILKKRGCYSRALDCFQRVLSISKKIVNPSITGSSLLRLGACFVELCNYTEAKKYYEMALKIFETIDWKGEQGFVIRGIGNVYQAMGDYTLALRYYRRALKLFKDIRHQRKIANLFINISSVFIEIGEFSRAKKYVEDALKITTTLELQGLEVDCYIGLCRINTIVGNYVTAIDYYRKGMKFAKKIKIKREVLRLLLLASDIYYYEKRYLKGIEIANKAAKIAKEMGTKDLHVETLLIKVKHGVKQGVLSTIESFGILDKATMIAKEIGCPEVLWKAYFEYGKLLQNNREYLEALEYYQKCNDIFGNVGGTLRNESYRKSYLDHPDRQAVYAAKNEIKKIIELTDGRFRI